MVHDLVEVAGDKQQVLPGQNAVVRRGKGVCDIEYGRAGTGVVDARIALARDPDFQVQRTFGHGHKLQVRRQYGILQLAVGEDLDRATVKPKDQRAPRAGAQQMELAGRTYQHVAAATQDDRRVAIVGSHTDIGEQARDLSLHLKTAVHPRVPRRHRTHGIGRLLRRGDDAGQPQNCERSPAPTSRTLPRSRIRDSFRTHGYPRLRKLPISCLP